LVHERYDKDENIDISGVLNNRRLSKDKREEMKGHL